MVSVLVIAALAASAAPGGPSSEAEPIELDRQCFRLMEHLARSDEPRIRTLATAAAHFFLGRLDASGLSLDDDASERDTKGDARLIGQCSDLLDAGGYAFRAGDAPLTPAHALPPA